VFDVAGRLVATLVDGPQPAGPGSADWDGRDARGAAVSSGVYIYRITADGPRQIARKMVLLK